GLVDAAGAEVDRLHHLDVGFARPVDELVQSEGVRLDGVPGAVESAWPVFDRTDPVLPEVTRNEVAARVAHDRRTELLDEREHVAAEAALVGLGMAGLEDAGVD